MTIGIVGHGYVGKAVEHGFSGKNKIIIYDKYKDTDSLEKVVSECEVIFVCVPTPMNDAYTQIDLSYVEDAVGNIVSEAKKTGKEPVLVLKSTAVPGTTERLARELNYPKIVFNPEFFREKYALQDFVNADRVVIGGRDEKAVKMVEDLHRESLPKVPIFKTDATSAEMVKYMSNVFLATKVIFGNEMFEVCEKLGIDYHEVKKMVVADHRIVDSHLDVTDLRGFGGKCFPKDVAALIGFGKNLGADMSLMETIWKKNLKIRRDYDWEKIPGAVSNNDRFKK